MTLVREEQPPPGSFDYLLTGPPIMDKPVPGRRGWWKAATPETPKAMAPPPPPPVRRGGNPCRVRVEIEIIDSRARKRAERQRSRWATAILLWVIVAVVLLLGRATGHAENWTSYQDSWITRYHGDAGSSALSYRQGFTTIFQMTGKDGRTTECRSYQQGFQTITRCD